MAKQESDMVREILALGEDARKNLIADDFKHLKRIIWVNRLLLLVGYGTAWIIPNPISMVCISLAIVSMWAIVSHHVLHGGYDNVPNTPKRYHSSRFAQGWRRYIDWVDWMYPEAWVYEHNVLHHYYTNEEMDPDQMSYRLKPDNRPKWVKIFQRYLRITAWKPWYYARNTMKAYNEKKNYKQDMNWGSYRRKYYVQCYIPYIGVHFILIPLLFYPLGWLAVFYVFINRLGAEFIANWHTFLIIVPNHTGADLMLFQQHFKTQEDFVKRQILSSCNFSTGGFWNDYLHGYLNYQIEHHLFPDLPISQYVKLQPKVKKICEKYNFTYLQEPLSKRVKKLFAIIQRKEKMQSLLSEDEIQKRIP